MLRKIYIALGAGLIFGYMSWSLLGMEWEGNRKDSVPRISERGSSGSSGRRSYGFFGGGYGGYGK